MDEPKSMTPWVKWMAARLRVDFDDNGAKMEILYCAVERIHGRQTADEQNSGSTIEDNKIGWSGADAEFMTDMAAKLKEWTEGRSSFPRPWSPGQLAVVRRIMKRYAMQLARLAWAKKQARAA